MRYQRLDAEAVKVMLADLPDWQLAEDGHSIGRSFRFASFAEAFGFMAECALAAEKLDHHPVWTNDYRRVDLVLTTHATGCLTDRDAMLAGAMDKVARRRD